MQQMPPITKNLIIINVIVFLAQQVSPNLTEDFGLHFVLANDFMPYQLLTYMFLHGGWSHLFFNMFALWMFGRTMEQVWGQKRFIFYYLVCGAGAGLMQELTQGISFWVQGLADSSVVNVMDVGVMSIGEYLNYWTTIGASGACYAILLGFGMTFPNERIMLLIPPIPMKAKYFVMGYAVIELLSGLDGGDKVAHFAHLGGMIFGVFIILYWRKQDKRKSQNVFTSWTTYGNQMKKESLWDKIKNYVESNIKKTRNKNESYSPHQQDYDYNARKRATEDELNRILEKIKKTGYEALTEEEKRKLFDVSKKK